LTPGLLRNKRLTLALLCGAQFMVILDVSVIWVALPSMRADLSFSTEGLQWVVNAYTIALAGVLLLGGRAGDLLGRRRVFLAAVTLFTLSSLACGAARSQEWLVAARALQGLGGALVLPATLALVTTLFDKGPQRDRAVAFWGATGGIAGSVGFLLGGGLTEAFGWQAVFLINVPVGVGIAMLTRRAIPADPELPAVSLREFDALGTVLVTSGLVALVFAIVRTESVGWGATQTLGALALACALLAAFVAAEVRHPRPLLPLHVFRSRELCAANGAIILFGAVRFGMWFVMSLYMQEVLGYSPAKTGLSFLPLALLMAVGSSRASAAVRRFGSRATIVGSFVVTAAGMSLLTQIRADGTFIDNLLPPSVVLALALGISLVPLTLAAVHGVSGSDAGLASGLVNVSRQVGGAIGVAVLGTVAASQTAHMLASGHAGHAQALTAGYQRAFWFAAAFALAGAAISLFLPPGRQAEHHTALAIEKAST
jgi:EmrB/QacA subfamily drug resistance transporter